MTPEQNEGADLTKELHDDAKGDEGIQDDTETKETPGDRESTQEEEGQMRKATPGMQSAKDLKENPFLGGGIRNTGIAE